MGDVAPKRKIIPVEAVLRERLTISQVLDRDWLKTQIQERNLDFSPTGPFALAGDLFASGVEIFFRGRLAAEFRLPCGRCLEEFSIKMDGPLEAHWRMFSPPGPKVVENSDQRIPLEDLDTGVIQEEGVDLWETMLEQVILNLPMRPLCRDSCRGLCPVCGENRNIHPCRCGEKGKNNPFEGLKKIQLS
ncbi:MAG: DUF177 domain-containing protein [Desulfobacteraceae bacterium]|nr:MAG: DUF177 domain-containing protein [Desulfobacteraceae bacterium]